MPERKPESDPNRDKDNLADALARLAAGEAPDDHLSDGRGLAPSDVTPLDAAQSSGISSAALPTTDPQAAPKPVSSDQGRLSDPQGRSPAPSGSAKVAQPVVPVPAKPSLRPTVPGAAVPKLRPSSAPAPRLRPAAPEVSQGLTAAATPSLSQNTRPAAPRAEESTRLPTQEMSPAAARDDGFPSSEALSSALENVIETDEVDAPAPDSRVFAPKRTVTRQKRLPIYATLGFRRTMIPILLTIGIAFPALAVWWFMLPQENPLRSASIAVPVTLVIVGIVMLVLALLNMAQVKRQLQARG